MGRLWKIAIQQDLAFRWQVVSNVLGSALTVLFALMTFHIAYSHTQGIGGWNKYQAFLLVGIFQLYTVLSSVFLSPNLAAMMGTVYEGELDGLLLLPVSAQLVLSLRSINLTNTVNLVPGLCVIVYALVQLGIAPTVGDMFLCVVMLLTGIVTVYALWFISLTLEFWFAGMWSWQYFIPYLFEFARYPDGIYKGSVKVVFMTVAPVVVVANVPARAILGDLAWKTALYSLCLAGVMLMLSRLQWKWALRHYTSASS